MLVLFIYAQYLRGRGGFFGDLLDGSEINRPNPWSVCVCGGGSYYFRHEGGLNSVFIN